MSIFKLEIKNSIGWWEWNDPQSPVNLLSSSALEELESFIENLEKQNLKALVLISGKAKGFIAGADIKEIEKIQTEEEISRFIDKGHGLFTRLEKLPAMKIAAIHGACLGGGLELTLTFDYRITSDSPETSLGLPEVRLGLIPGLGGCVRLPKLVGLKKALEIILKGKTLSSKQAFSMGLTDEVLPLAGLKKRAAELADLVEKEHFSKNPPGKKFAQIMENYSPIRPLIFYLVKRKILKETKGLYPAPLAALNVIRKTFGSRNLKRALNIEKNHFFPLVCNEKSKNLIRIFFLVNKAKKPSSSPLRGEKIKSIGVLGAGTMGSSLAYTLSDKGFFTRLMDVKEEALAKALKKAERLWQKQIKREGITPYEIKNRRGNLSPTLSYQGFSSLDMVIETLPEDLQIKREVLGNMEGFLNEKVIVASSTSSLNLEKIASLYPWPHRFLGIHFFNPPYKMPLVEIIKTDKTENFVLETALEFVRKTGKIPVIVKASPGFLVNRLLACYLSEALWFLNEGKSIIHVDKLFSKKFGLPMGPFRLMDEIGLDICFQVVKNLKEAGLNLDIPDETTNLPAQLGLGRKEGRGFYSYGGNKPSINPKLEEIYPCPRQNTLPLQEGIERGIYLLINEGFKTLEEKVVESEEDIDLAMVLAIGFPPVYGGPLTYGRQKGLAFIKERLEFWHKNQGGRFLLSEKLRKEADFL